MSVDIKQQDSIPDLTKEQAEFNQKINEFIDKLPIHPRPLLDYTESDKKNFLYTDDPKDKNKRMKEKLYSIWKLWGIIYENEIIKDILNNVPKNDQCDEYKAKCVIVNILDILGKIFHQSNTIEELFF